MNIRDARLAQLLVLLSEHSGRRGELAKRIGKSPSQLSQWLGGHRTITEDSAREIETKAKKPQGWLDTPHIPAVKESLTPQPPDLAQALPVVLDAIAACPDRDELRALLPLLATGAPAYRQRLAELLAQHPDGPNLTRQDREDARRLQAAAQAAEAHPIKPRSTKA